VKPTCYKKWLTLLIWIIHEQNNFFSNPRYTDRRGINSRTASRLIVILDALDVIEQADEMDISGLYFHKLKGARKGRYCVRVSGNWRITWKMDGKDVTDVNLEDYH